MPKPGGTVARGYGAAHRKLREQAKALVDAGQAVCARCGRMIAPGSAFDLDHNPDRSGYLGPSHVPCNRAAGARVGNGRRRARRRGRIPGGVFGPLSS